MDMDEILKAGNQIMDSVDAHISSGDFKGLSREIRDITSGGAPLSDSFKDKAQKINAGNHADQKRHVRYPDTFSEKAVNKTKETLKKGVFLVLAVIFILAAIIFFAAGALGARICFVFGIVFVLLIIYCFYRVRTINRIKKAYAFLPGYAGVIGDRVWCEVATLAHRNRQKPEDTIKTIEILIRTGCMPAARLSKDNKILFMTAEAYHSYTQEQESARDRNEEKLRKEQALPPSVQDLIREGERYVTKIRAYNAAIPGKEFSQQLDQLEACTRNVFELVREDPANAQNLQRMLDYYLPTTDKMLRAYVDLEKRRIPDQSNAEIEETQQEIEEAICTINAAFTKLLNDLIRTRSWDVRSDISAMETMMKQDGLV